MRNVFMAFYGKFMIYWIILNRESSLYKVWSKKNHKNKKCINKKNLFLPMHVHSCMFTFLKKLSPDA